MTEDELPPIDFKKGVKDLDKEYNKRPVFITITLVVIILLTVAFLSAVSKTAETKEAICHAITGFEQTRIYQINGVENCCYGLNGEVRCKEWQEFSWEEELRLEWEARQTATSLRSTTLNLTLQ